MPVSEDEFERPVQMGANQSAMSKAEQRKSNKPIMEKRRRARINHCLNELKTLILDAMKKDPARHSKLEKADILEMTVKHLQQIQRQQLATAVATDPSVLMRFKSGFDECAAEVNRYISRLEGVDSGVKQRLAAHLHRCVSSIQQISAFPHQNVFSGLNQNCDKTTIVLPNASSVPGDVNNNSNQAERIQVPTGLHLIPSRLPSGELALLVPNSHHMTTFLSAAPGATFQFPQTTSLSMGSVLSPSNPSPSAGHTSAFTAVNKNQDYPSPTSTADIVKKESNFRDKEDLSGSSYKNGAALQQNIHLENYGLSNYIVTENKIEREKNDGTLSKCNHMESSHELTDVLQKFRKLNNFGIKLEGMGNEQKITQKANSSYQRTVADSTTSFLQPKELEIPEFKPFQVDIPNSHLKAQISISENSDEVKISPLTIQQKPNPNFNLNPNRLNPKSPPKFTKHMSSPEVNFSDFGGKSEIGFENFFKIETLTSRVKSEKIESFNSNLMKPSSSETFQNIEGVMNQESLKRPRSNESPELACPSSSESPRKTPRISLNVTLTDGQLKDEKNRCKRISVIVEDSSKTNGKENKSEVTVNVSSQKDMWRPW